MASNDPYIYDENGLAVGSNADYVAPNSGTVLGASDSKDTTASSSSSSSGSSSEKDAYIADKIAQGHSASSAEKKWDNKNSGSSASDDAKKAAEAAQKKADEAAARTRGDIKTGFGGIQSSLTTMGDSLSGLSDSDMANVGVQQNTQTGLADSAFNTAMGKLGNQRTEVEAGKKQSLNDLSQDVRNSFMAGNLYLGARGASNSSATGMYALAMQQAANKNRADISRQSAGSLDQIRQRETDAGTAQSDAKKQIEAWGSEQKNAITQHYGQLANDIETAKIDATADELAALNQLSMQVMNAFQQKASELEATVINYELEIDAMEQQARLNNQGIAGYGNYEADQVINPELDSSITSTGVGRQTASVDGYGVPLKKPEEEQLLMSVPPKKEEEPVYSQNPNLPPNYYAGRQSTQPNFSANGLGLDLGQFLR